MTAKPATHPCCVPSCTRHTLVGHLACRNHWQRVPTDIREQLATLFRRRTTDPTAYSEAVNLAQQFIRRHA